jgi:hypothetical protein
MDLWEKLIGLDWFAMPTPPRISGFSCSRLSLHCSRRCTAETHSVCPRSYLQGRRAWLYLLCAVPVLLSHHWLSTCSRVVCCLARALACGIKSSRLLAKHFRSHSRTRRFNSARTSGSCNSTVLSICCDAIRTGLPPPPVLRCASNPRRSRLLLSRPPPYKGRGSRRSAACGEKREKGRQGKNKQRERKNGGGREKELPKDLCVKLENHRDLSVKHNISLI